MIHIVLVELELAHSVQQEFRAGAPFEERHFFITNNTTATSTAVGESFSWPRVSCDVSLGS